MKENMRSVTELYESFQNMSKYYNELLEPIVKQQEIRSTILSSGVQDVIDSLKAFHINLPKIEMPTAAIELAKPIIDSSQLTKMYEQFSAVTLVRNEFYEVVKSMNLGITNVINDIRRIDWDSILNEIEEQDLEVQSEAEGDIKAIITEVLSKNDLTNPNKSLDEKVEVLRDEMKAIKESQSPRNTIMLPIIANIIFTLFITLISPILEPIKEEYSTFVHEKGREVIKEIKQKVQNTFDIALIEHSYKIVSTETLSVRITNKKNTKKVGKLYFGQLVQVVERKRNWTKIRFESYDGNKIEGWVYSRYLESIR
ncbi:MAG TPA: SH3 domain-containing protein [Bacillota bacterium]|nr:SH3 domain-containing protein [Bacillota bacterium]